VRRLLLNKYNDNLSDPCFKGSEAREDTMFQTQKRSTLGLYLAIAYHVALAGCTAATSTKTTDYDSGVVVSGIVRDAVTRVAVFDVDVEMRVYGEIFKVTAGGDKDSGVSIFSFEAVPAGSEYLIKITDPNGVYAPWFYSGVATTYAAAGNNIFGIELDTFTITQDIGAAELYLAKSTNLTVKDIASSEAISGLSLYYDATENAVSNGRPTDIEPMDIIATEASGVYNFSLPNDGENKNIRAHSLVLSDGTEYGLYNDGLVTTAGLDGEGKLMHLKAGQDATLYLKKVDATPYTVIIHVVDEEGHAFDVGGVLSLTNIAPVAPGVIAISFLEFAEKKAGTTNEYVLTLTRSSLGDNRFVNPVDTDGDEVADYQVALEDDAADDDNLSDALSTTNALAPGAFDENRETTIVVPMKPVSTAETIAAQIISKDDNFQANGLAEIIIAFDRPVDLIHGVTMEHQELGEAESISVPVTGGNIYAADKTTTVFTVAGQNSLPITFGDNLPAGAPDTQNDCTYTYNDDAGAALTPIDASQAPISAIVAAARCEVVSPYGEIYDSVEQIRTLEATSEYGLTAGNTILTITLDATTLKAERAYTFSLSVEGKLAKNPRAFLTFTKTAKSSASTTLDELKIDNFDYKNTPQRTLVDPIVNPALANQEDYVGEFVTLSGILYTDQNLVPPGPSTAAPEFQYLSYALPADTAVLDDLNAPFSATLINASSNTLYIISKARLEGSIQVISFKEKYVNTSGAATVETIGVEEAYYGLNLAAGGITTGDTGQAGTSGDGLESLTALTETVAYLLDKPSNYGLGGTGYADVYKKVESGANITTEGLYYIYTIPTADLNVENGGAHIAEVTIDFKLQVNGVALGVETKTLTVQ
jgi:hypothetical protein